MGSARTGVVHADKEALGTNGEIAERATKANHGKEPVENGGLIRDSGGCGLAGIRADKTGRGDRDQYLSAPGSQAAGSEFVRSAD